MQPVSVLGSVHTIAKPPHILSARGEPQNVSLERYQPTDLRAHSVPSNCAAAVAYKFVSNNDFKKTDPSSPYLGLVRENVQRQHILGLWRAAGMGPADVGILSDMDEVFTRDFLRALQVL